MFSSPPRVVLVVSSSHLVMNDRGDGVKMAAGYLNEGDGAQLAQGKERFSVMREELKVGGDPAFQRVQWPRSTERRCIRLSFR